LLSEGKAAEHSYVEAVERLGRTPLRPELARSQLLYGEWLRREGRRDAARRQLRAAYEAFAAMNAEAFADRARRELLATGEKVRRRQVDTVKDLTPQEEHIARLACDGHTNPEIAAELFLSARTVEWHLRNVFGKLGIGSRKELLKALSRARSVPSIRDKLDRTLRRPLLRLAAPSTGPRALHGECASPRAADPACAAERLILGSPCTRFLRTGGTRDRPGLLTGATGTPQRQPA
jgi:DNA-binding CsgD family transcriptional regulator